MSSPPLLISSQDHFWDEHCPFRKSKRSRKRPGYRARRTRDLDAKGIPQWDEIYPDRATLQSDIEKQKMYVAEMDQTIAGMITLNQFEPPEYASVSWSHTGKVLVVHRLSVAPQYQGRKFVTLLMNFAEQFAASNGYNSIRLDAFTQNPVALALYEHRGYVGMGLVSFRKGSFYCYEKPVLKYQHRS